MSAPNTTRRRPTRRRRRALSPGRLLLAVIGTAGVLFAIIQLLRPGTGGDGASALARSAPTAVPTVSPEPTPGLPDVDVNSWQLRLVDLDHPLGADFVPPELQLVEDNERMDSRVAPAMEQLFTDAKAAGYTIYFCSGYREYASQYDLYWDHVDTYEGQGMTREEAETKTLISVQYPGCSEHQSGLCGDVLESRDQPMEPYIGGSGLMLWLEQHCADYGFVVRYPEGKTDITGIYYEPWHLRYVGTEAARYMMEHDLCLEEFVALYAGQDAGSDQRVAGAQPADADAAVVNTFSVSPKLASSAKCALVVDRDSGRALYERNTQDQIYPASTTKMMTALCAAEATEDLDKELVTVRQDVLDQLPVDDNSLAGLKAGQELTMRQLLYALMLPSGNDAALVIADHVSGSVEAFAGLMNQRAAELGCTGTYFVNPHGLAQTEQYSTAWDLARIAEAYLQVPALAEIAATHQISFSTSDGEQMQLKNSNLLLDPDSELYMPEACGVKTGIISLGASFISAAEKDGLRVLCVTLEVPATREDGGLITPNPALAEGRKYLDWACSSFQRVTLCDGAAVMNVPAPGSEEGIPASTGQTVTAVVPSQQAQQLTMTVEPADGLTDRHPDGGTIVGYVRWTCGDADVTDGIPLYALDTGSPIPLWAWIAVCALLALALTTALLAHSRRRRSSRRRAGAGRRRTVGMTGRRG